VTTWSSWVQAYACVGIVWYGARQFMRLNRNRPIVSKEDDGKYLVRRDLRRTGERRFR